MRQIFPLPQFVIKNLCLSGYCKSNLTVRSRNVGRIRQLGGASTSISDKRNLCWEPWEGAGGHSADKWKGLGRNCCAVGEIFRNGNANLKILDAPAQTSTIGALFVIPLKIPSSLVQPAERGWEGPYNRESSAC